MVGDVVHLTNLEPDKTFSRITKARNPPIFEIPDFLTPAECDHIIHLANNHGLHGATMFDKSAKTTNQKQRKGETTFISPSQDEQLRKIQTRVINLTQMPAEIVEESEPYQVGHYGVGGFYHAHYDSSTASRGSLQRLPCCMHLPGEKHSISTCHYCRYVTVLMYLNDVEVGGETAFPIADKPGGSVNTHNVNLTSSCHEASVVVGPKKGKAVMWYNNFRDPENGWLGEYDPKSLHGGCPVIKGEKWISNVWISAAQYDNRNMKTIYSKP